MTLRHSTGLQRWRHVRQRRPWAGVCLVAMLFSALHGLLGAWVVSALAAPTQRTVEVCTPQGLQWRAVAASGVGQPEVPSSEWPQGLAKPCAWSAAHGVVGTLWMLERGGWCGGDHPAPGPLGWVRVRHLPDTAQRVLLMSAMRAPPVRG